MLFDSTAQLSFFIVTCVNILQKNVDCGYCPRDSVAQDNLTCNECPEDSCYGSLSNEFYVSNFPMKLHEWRDYFPYYGLWFYVFNRSWRLYIENDFPLHKELELFCDQQRCEASYYRNYDILVVLGNNITLAETILEEKDQWVLNRESSRIKLNGTETFKLFIVPQYLNHSEIYTFIFCIDNGGYVLDISNSLAKKLTHSVNCSQGKLVNENATSGDIFADEQYVYAVVSIATNHIYIHRTGIDSSTNGTYMENIEMLCSHSHVERVVLSNFNSQFEGRLYVSLSNVICVYSYDKIVNAFNIHEKFVSGLVLYRYPGATSSIKLVLIESRNYLAWRTLLVSYIMNKVELGVFFDERPKEFTRVKMLGPIYLNSSFSIDYCKLKLLNATWDQTLPLIQCSQLFPGQCQVYGPALGCKYCGTCKSVAHECHETGDHWAVVKNSRIFSKFTPLLIEISDPIYSPIPIKIRSAPYHIMCDPPLSYLAEARPKRLLNCSVKFQSESIPFGSLFILNSIELQFPLTCEPLLVKPRMESAQLIIVDPKVSAVEPKYMIKGHPGFVKVTFVHRTGSEVTLIDFGLPNVSFKSRLINSSTFEVRLMPNMATNFFHLRINRKNFAQINITSVERPSLRENYFKTFKERRLNLKIIGKHFLSFYKPKIDLGALVSQQGSGLKSPETILSECDGITDTSMTCLTPEIIGDTELSDYRLHMVSHDEIYSEDYNLIIKFRATPILIFSNYKTSENKLELIIENLDTTYPKRIWLINDDLKIESHCEENDFSISPKGALLCSPAIKLVPDAGWNLVFIIELWSVSSQKLHFDGILIARKINLKQILVYMLVILTVLGFVSFLCVTLGLKAFLSYSASKFTDADSASIEDSSPTYKTDSIVKKSFGASKDQLSSLASFLSLKLVHKKIIRIKGSKEIKNTPQNKDKKESFKYEIPKMGRRKK